MTERAKNTRKSQNMRNIHTGVFTTSPTLPAELYPPIVRRSHPEAGHNLRCLNRNLSNVITQDDLVWGEFGWRWYHQRRKRCWIWAAKHGHVKVVEWLMEEETEDEHQRCWWEAGFVAVKFGRTEVVNALMGVSDVEERGRSAYMWYFGITDDKYTLEEETLDPERVLPDEEIFDPEILPEWKEYSRLTDWKNDRPVVWSQAYLRWEWGLKFLFFVAARNGQVDMMKLLLQMGLKQERVKEMTAIYMPVAVHSGCLDAVKFLVDIGFHVHMAFDEAAREGRVEMLEYVLPKWLEHPYSYYPGSADKAFMDAAHNGHEKVVALFLDRGIVHSSTVPYRPFRIGKPEENEEALVVNMALIEAAKNGHAATVRLLLNRGADAKARALNSAGGDGRAEVIEVLSA
ncbi:hypothetical protein HK104_008620 [Borealophlyctis nickersoniae]|nr:hypothetical protein HK104_008620 [Borealophlyctis nickersoniae]